MAEGDLIYQLDPEDRLVNRGTSVSHLLGVHWKSLLLHMWVPLFKKRFIEANSISHQDYFEG